jgi:hypothetical protein
MFLAVYVFTFALHRLWPHQFSSVFVGAMLVVPLWAVSLLAAGRPSTAKWARGADGEEWTAGALRRALGPDYAVVNDIQLGSSNIDHVVVGPAGVFVVETKWTGKKWASAEGASRIETARKQVRGASRHVQRALEAAAIPVSPRSVVVLWGGDSRDWNEKKVLSSMQGEIPAVAGTSVRLWASTLSPGVIDRAQRHAIVCVLEAMHVPTPVRR